MTEKELLDLFTRVLRDLVGDDSIVLRMETQRADIPQWDSFTYINFVLAIEIGLGIKFRVADVESFMTIGDVVASAHALLANQAAT